MKYKTLFALILALAAATFAAAQGNPTGAIRGAVSDQAGLAMPGVSVTVASPALQGTKTAVTSGNGEFLIPFLPPGEYTVTFELQGFQTQKQTIGVAMAETAPMKITLAVAALTESVTVTGTASTEVLTTGTVAETYQSKTLDLLPVGRTLNDAVLLAPGVNNNGPSGNIVIGGALSYENLFLVNGVNVNENLRGQARLLYIEDAIQETKVSSGSISAEYGRFQGGVVNMITKSGGNRLSGSFRDSMSNDSWRALAPLNDQKVDQTVPVYEATLGGPVLKDRLWFFGAGRYSDRKVNQTLDQTNLNFVQGTRDERGEGKLTLALNSANKLVGSYTKKTQKNTNNTSNGPLDYASLYDNKNLDTLTVVNYSSVITSNLFFEGQYSRKGMETLGTGAQYEDFVRGTMLIDRPTGGRYNSPTFCAVCGKGWDETRNNWDWFLKLGYFLSTKSAGSHNLVAGFDNFKESRQVDNYQSGSGYRLNVTRTIIDPGSARTLYPVVDKNSYLNWTPLVAESVGSDIKTYSAFVNDAWRLNDRFSFNVGFRYDRNVSKDQGGVLVVKDWQWSPRLGVTWDIKGNGKWIANSGFARYVQGMTGAVVDAGSKGGRTASYSWNYTGSATYNTNCVPGSTPCLTAADILPNIWTWFQSVGGTNSTNYRSAPSIPGVTAKVATGVKAPSTDEINVGLAHDLGHGAVRVDYVYRTVKNMYGSYTDKTTGTVTDPTGRTYDAELEKNTPDAKRWYHGITLNTTYRLKRAQIGGNYTLSWSKGNVAGENVGSGPIMASINTFPEYRSQAWNWPDGYNGNDQRHKLRMFASYTLPLPPAVGQFTVGAVQRFDSGTPYDMQISVDSRPYVTNPGYLKPPATVGYYLTGRGALRWDNTWATDLSLNWTKKLPRLGATELFFRGVVTNVFNGLAQQAGNTTVASAASPGSFKNLVAFNPFTTTPVEGVNWAKNSLFGQATNPRDYQFPRSASFSLGVRF